MSLRVQLTLLFGAILVVTMTVAATLGAATESALTTTIAGTGPPGNACSIRS